MRSKAKALRTLLVSGLLAGLCGCMADTRFMAFVSLGQKGWTYSDTLNYVIPPLRGAGECGVSILLRTEGYGYGNIAVVVDAYQDSAQLYHKLHHYLLGGTLSVEGIGRRCDYTLPVSNLVLCDTLPTTITLVHRMEQTTLMGVREVGVRIGALVDESGKESWRVIWQ